MELNADFDERAVVHGAALDWVPSPIPGVDRRMLDRIGAEKARATSIVRYAPNSRFAPHVHTGGEEYLVLEGVFEDDHGAFPVGSYVRNPPESRHTPGSTPGCTILVKLWQFDLSDRTQVQIDTNKMPFIASVDRSGVEIMPLFQDDRESVRLERWAPGAAISLCGHDGLEIFVLTGGFEEGDEAFAPHSWLRLPKDQPLAAKAGPDGTKVWVKSGHLARPQTAPG